MKKIIIGDFIEYNYPNARLGNYHICNQFIRDGYEALWMSNAFNRLIWLKDRNDYSYKRSISSAERHAVADGVYGFAPWSTRLYGNYPFSKDANIIRNFKNYVKPNPEISFKKMDFDSVELLWISNPKMFWLADVVKYEKLVYRIADDYSQFHEFPNICEVEKEFIRKASTVFITSDVFRNKVEDLGVQAHLLNNAVDLDCFLKPSYDIPKEYQQSDKKRIVYVGAIKYWLDQQLLKELANSTEADIYLIGSAGVSLDLLQDCQNIRILGPRPYEDVAAYMHHADVAVIPFITGETTAAISPLKLYEYCAAGTPVVSTAMEEVKRSGAPISIASDTESFINEVQKHLKSEKPSDALRNYARSHSWSSRYTMIQEVLHGSRD